MEQETFAEWRERIRAELEGIDVTLRSEVDLEEGAEPNCSVQSFGWKSLDEETQELMNQLERLRLREVNKVKDAIVKAKEEQARKILRLEKQKNVLSVQVSRAMYNYGFVLHVLNALLSSSLQISALTSRLPRIGEDLFRFEAARVEAEEEVRVLLKNAEREAEKIRQLKALQRENR